MLRLVLHSLLYLLMGWVTRAIMGVSYIITRKPLTCHNVHFILQATTIASAIYVPLKAYYVSDDVNLYFIVCNLRISFPSLPSLPSLPPSLSLSSSVGL